MRDIEWLKRKAPAYDLVAEYIDDNSLKVYSPKFNFDGWMIVETENEIELWHQSKHFGVKNVTYHLQKSVPKYKKIWVLQRIKSHNKFVAFNKYRTNIVDKLLTEERPKFKIT